MRNQVSGFGMGCLLGLTLLLGGMGCSSSDAPESPLETTVQGGSDLKTKVPSGEEIEQVAGDAVEAVAGGVSAVWDKTSSAMKNFEGGKEMLADMKEMYGSAKTSLNNVTSKESAEKAKGELDKLSDQIDKWKPKLSEMSAETKVGVKRFFDHVADQLSMMGEKLNENEWVNEILRPKLREIIEQLKSLV